jgi:uncharacterized protein
VVDEGRAPVEGPLDGPSWAGMTPMGGFRDGHDPTLHERDWAGQLAAAGRGPTQWGFAAYFAGFGGFYLVGLLLTATGVFDNIGAPQHRDGALLLVSFAPNLLLGLAPAVLSWWKGGGLRRDFGIVPTRRDVWIGLACGGASTLLGLLLHLLLNYVFRHSPQQADPLQGFGGGHTVWLVLVGLFAVLGAPLTEELLVRGALWGALEHYRVHRYAILAVTSLLFAFMHQEPQFTLALFCQGLAIGSARMITGRIGSSMIAHATNNLIPALGFF